MNIELREDSVLISGYVNAVERYSKPINEYYNGKYRTFIERIQSGAFKKALERNENVLCLLNHDYNNVLASTKDSTAILEEDSIGLRAEVTITDADVVEKARNGQLVGWSFGFRSNDDISGNEGTMETRTVTDLDLVEVSILDRRKRPAYNGTSITARADGEKTLEMRDSIEEMNMDDFVDAVASKVAEKLVKREEQPEEKTNVDYSALEERLNKLKR